MLSDIIFCATVTFMAVTAAVLFYWVIVGAETHQDEEVLQPVKPHPAPSRGGRDPRCESGPCPLVPPLAVPEQWLSSDGVDYGYLGRQTQVPTSAEVLMSNEAIAVNDLRKEQ